MEDTIKNHAPFDEGGICLMTEQLENVHKKLNDVENQQVLLNEKVDLKFEILTLILLFQILISYILLHHLCINDFHQHIHHYI